MEAFRKQFERETKLSFDGISINGVHVAYIEWLEAKITILTKKLNNDLSAVVSGSACRCEKCTGLKSAESFYED